VLDECIYFMIIMEHIRTSKVKKWTNFSLLATCLWTLHMLHTKIYTCHCLQLLHCKCNSIIHRDLDLIFHAFMKKKSDNYALCIKWLHFRQSWNISPLQAHKTQIHPIHYSLHFFSCCGKSRIKRSVLNESTIFT